MAFRSLKSWLMPVISQQFLSRSRLLALREKAEIKRNAQQRPHVLHFFHELEDPYSQLLAQAIPLLQSKYSVSVVQHLVGPPDDSAAPEREKLKAYSQQDASRLAKQYGLQWAGVSSTSETTSISSKEALLTSQRLRKKWGHYLSGVIYYEGEWYWGIDRLHFLESRLTQQGLDRTGGAPNYPAHEITLGAGPKATSKTAKPQPVLHAFISFRSPYSYICLPRAKALADHYGAELRLRFVMPMVMRGLPVPRAKQYYISTDTKREAERVGLRYGTMVDPVGLGVERGLAVLHHAIQEGHGYDFALSFTQGAFADGIDATTDAGLGQMAKRAGVSDATVKAALADEGWRTLAEANREEMFAGGLWGVPSFRINDGEARWGQDRLWAIEQDLIAAL